MMQIMAMRSNIIVMMKRVVSMIVYALDFGR
jgi:hypothetical protein